MTSCVYVHARVVVNAPGTPCVIPSIARDGDGGGGGAIATIIDRGDDDDVAGDISAACTGETDITRI